jgi:short subunit dehydrogenase-like uncharacterized protein
VSAGFGATGFTGGLVAEYLARSAPAGARIALAGRSVEKLERHRGRLSQINPMWAALPLVRADVEDGRSLRELAASTRVLASVVGPYLIYGEPLVAAGAAAGTDYLDLAGEPAFVDRMWLKHHAAAERNGARLIHSCGWTAVPHDLGVRYLVDRLQTGESSSPSRLSAWRSTSSPPPPDSSPPRSRWATL